MAARKRSHSNADEPANRRSAPHEEHRGDSTENAHVAASIDNVHDPEYPQLSRTGNCDLRLDHKPLAELNSSELNEHISIGPSEKPIKSRKLGKTGNFKTEQAIDKLQKKPETAKTTQGPEFKTLQRRKSNGFNDDFFARRRQEQQAKGVIDTSLQTSDSSFVSPLELNAEQQGEKRLDNGVQSSESSLFIQPGERCGQQIVEAIDDGAQSLALVSSNVPNTAISNIQGSSEPAPTLMPPTPCRNPLTGRLDNVEEVPSAQLVVAHRRSHPNTSREQPAINTISNPPKRRHKNYYANDRSGLFPTVDRQPPKRYQGKQPMGFYDLINESRSLYHREKAEYWARQLEKLDCNDPLLLSGWKMPSHTATHRTTQNLDGYSRDYEATVEKWSGANARG